jgi:hypothetical protein
VGLLARGATQLRELRKWTLAPLGAVLAVVLLAAGVVTMLATGGEPGPEALIRKYFSSAAGGGATPEQARRIDVPNCQLTNRIVRNEFVNECTVIWGGRRYTGCFAFDDDRVVLGSRELGGTSGCPRLVWDSTAESLVIR